MRLNATQFFAAGLQIEGKDMLRVGDWIEVAQPGRRLAQRRAGALAREQDGMYSVVFGSA